MRRTPIRPWPTATAAACTLLLVCPLIAASGARAQATFHALPGALGGGGSTVQTDLSADGSVVAFGQAGDNQVGFVEVPSFGAVQLADCPGGAGDTTNARGISGDGNVAVGVSVCFVGGAFEAVRSLSLSGVPDPDPFSETNFQSFAVARMGELPGGAIDSRATAASHDGSAIVGWSSSGTSGLPGGSDEAFRWTNPDAALNPLGTGQMIGLGFLSSAGDSASRAYDISADGLVVVGQSRNGSLRAEAVVWAMNPDGTLQSAFGLGDLQTGTGTAGISSTALAVSADGGSVVGEARAVPGSAALEAFLYSRTSGQMLRLAGPSGEHIVSRALAVSADGSVVVGSMQGAAGGEAFIWTEAAGMRSLRGVALAQAVVGDATADFAQWTLMEASGISADGLTISGYGRSTEPGIVGNQGWVLRLTSVPEPGTALLGALALVGWSVARRRRA